MLAGAGQLFVIEPHIPSMMRAGAIARCRRISAAVLPIAQPRMRRAVESARIRRVPVVLIQVHFSPLFFARDDSFASTP